MSTFRHTSAGTKLGWLTTLFSQLPAAHFDALFSVPLEQVHLCSPPAPLTPALQAASCFSSCLPSLQVLLLASPQPPCPLRSLRAAQRSCSSTTTASPSPAAQLVLVPEGRWLVLQLRGRVAALISPFLSNACRLLPHRPEGAVRLQKLHYSQTHRTASGILSNLIPLHPTPHTPTLTCFQCFFLPSFPPSPTPPIACAIIALGVARHRVTWKATGDSCFAVPC